MSLQPPGMTQKSNIYQYITCKRIYTIVYASQQKPRLYLSRQNYHGTKLICLGLSAVFLQKGCWRYNFTIS